jgi:hypothetical protein
MTHPRQSIRDSVTLLLKGGGTLAGTDVADTRIHAFREAQQPSIRVTTPDDEAVDWRALAPTVVERRVTVAVECYVRANSDRADDLDDLCREVEILMDNYPTLNDAANRSIYRDTTMEVSAEVDPPVAYALLNYDVFYIDDLE